MSFYVVFLFRVLSFCIFVCVEGVVGENAISPVDHQDLLANPAEAHSCS
jgi:hypothetical protein